MYFIEISKYMSLYRLYSLFRIHIINKSKQIYNSKIIIMNIFLKYLF